MSAERPYDSIGREPVEDEAVDAAIAAYRADHPDADEMHLRNIDARLRRLNAEARARAEHQADVQRIIDQAADDGVAMSWAVVEDALREERERTRRDQEVQLRRRARLYAEQEAKRPPQPRPRGRPPGSRTVGREQIVAKFCELRERLRRNPTQSELAENLQPKVSVRTLSDMLTEYGLPWPIDPSECG